MAAGTILLLFVAYQLWGTGLAEARSQSTLKDAFEQLVQQNPPAQSNDFAPPMPTGSAVAIIKIPKIGVEKAVVQGVSVEDLKKGPGHYPDTPMPGQAGNAAIAGHRTTYGAPFYNLDELAPNDPIFVSTTQGSFRYEVIETKIVKPSQVDVLDATDDNRLTLTTCHPRFSASQRMIVTAKLIGAAATTPPVDPNAEKVDEGKKASLGFGEEAGLSGEHAPRGPAVMSGLAFAGVWIVAYMIRRQVGGHKLLVWGAAALPMGVTLFVFFENFARLLPANV